MKKTFTVGRKMLIIGIILVAGIFVLGGNSYMTHRKIDQTTAESVMRSTHNDLCSLIVR